MFVFVHVVVAVVAKFKFIFNILLHAEQIFELSVVCVYTLCIYALVIGCYCLGLFIILCYCAIFPSQQKSLKFVKSNPDSFIYPALPLPLRPSP